MSNNKPFLDDWIPEPFDTWLKGLLTSHGLFWFFYLHIPPVWIIWIPFALAMLVFAFCVLENYSSIKKLFTLVLVYSPIPLALFYL